MGSAGGVDEVHMKIMQSFQAMKSSAANLKQIEVAGIAYHTKLKEAGEAAGKFFGAVEMMSHRAMESSGMANIGYGFRNVSNCASTLHDMHQEYLRAMAESVILPISNTQPVDQRNLQTMQKQYEKYCKQYLDEQRRAEKELDKWAKKARRNADRVVSSNLANAQQNLSDRVADLSALRMYSLRQALTEERRRYVVLLEGLLDILKVQRAYSSQSVEPLNNCITTCEPLCQNPNVLPPDFDIGLKRGDRMEYGFARDRFGFSIKSPPMSPTERGMMRPSMRRPFEHQTYNPNFRGRGGGSGYQRNPGLVKTGSNRPMVAPWESRSHGDVLSEHFADSRNDMDDARSLPPGADIKSNDLPKDHYKVVHGFSATEPGQLSLSMGDVVEVDGEPEDEWIYGRNNGTGKSGWFPASYINYKH
eukprot:m.29547 g.29547  ORF g.29547 m.29547 type:complete len:418 (+) comp8115_c0_seq1:192-1445(+)